jgi:cyclophilin family peptidyl-prolyl cis-trans isomerase
MRHKNILILAAFLVLALAGLSLSYTQLALRNSPHPTPVATPTAVSTAPKVSPLPEPTPSSTSAPKLEVNASGLSEAEVKIETTQGTLKFRFYTLDAPKTVNRMVQLIQQGFYNGLVFHRVIADFVIQTGDPHGNGTGGSGTKLAAEFNSRRHVEGTVAMARGADKDSADSQFYISLGTLPHLDQNYTVFGQVTEGMDIAKRIKVGDKIIRMTVQ